MAHHPTLPLLLALTTACGADSGREPEIDRTTIRGMADYRVAHYDYQFNIGTYEAVAELTIEVESEGHCFDLGFRADRLSDLTIDGGQATADTVIGEERALVCAHEGFLPGETAIVSARNMVLRETWGRLQVGFSLSEDIEGGPFYYLVSWVGGCDRFGVCDPRSDKFSTYRFTVDHPEGFTVLCPGTIDAGDTQTTCSFDFPGGPTYSTFGLAASQNWKVVDLGDWGGVKATLYDMPTADFETSFDVEQHKAFLAWMVDNFGPYPYGNELRFSIGPTVWNGFEHPGNIILNDRLNLSNPLQPTAYSNPLAHTTNHEIVHQWAGDQTTLASTHDFVWKEAMAEYLTFVFESEQVGADVGDRSNRAWEIRAQSAEFWPVPMEKPALIDFYGDVYGSGPMVLFRQLEAIYDRDTVLRAISDLLGEERAIAVADIQAALEESTGDDLSPYFDSWVYGMGAPQWPVWDVDLETEGEDVTVTVSQRGSPKRLFGGSFVVQLLSASEGEEEPQTHDVRFNLGVAGKKSVTETVSPGFAVDSISFDPYGETLGSAGTTSVQLLETPAPAAFPTELWEDAARVKSR